MNKINYKHTHRMHNDIAALEILPFIFKLKKPNSILDVGCGNGSWLKAAKNLGVSEVFGIDGIQVPQEQMNISNEEFLKKDLTTTFNLNKKYDLVISLEVAEHLPKETADIFVKSLVNFSDFILFSAAIPEQGGQYHLNEQWPNYWNEKFKSNGFEAYDILRGNFWNNEKVFWWYKQNMILYIKKNTLKNSTLTPVNYVNALVHPNLYNKKTSKPKYLNSKKERMQLIINTLKSFVR